MIKKNQKIITTLGLELYANNFGCSALAISFLYMLNEIAKERNEIFKVNMITYAIPEHENYKYSNLNVELHLKEFKNFIFFRKLYTLCKKSNLIIDFTEGDSFTDIYGIKRFILTTNLKMIAVLSKKPFVIGPQTIGPFKTKFARFWAGYVLKRSMSIYTRDRLSSVYLREMSNISSVCVTDVATLLPYECQQFEHKKKRVGFNPSGLLYHGGYTRNNQFGLKIDYPEFCFKLIELLQKEYEIFLFPHVITPDYDSIENDLKVCRLLKGKYPQCTIADSYNNPIDAKTSISQMDLFIGSRMHATVAAFTSKVPTISIAYSRKFAGLYKNLDYPYVIDAKEKNTSETISLISEWIQDISVLEKKRINSQKIIEKKNTQFINGLKQILI